MYVHVSHHSNHEALTVKVSICHLGGFATRVRNSRHDLTHKIYTTNMYK